MKLKRALRLAMLAAMAIINTGCFRCCDWLCGRDDDRFDNRRYDPVPSQCVPASSGVCPPGYVPR